MTTKATEMSLKSTSTRYYHPVDFDTLWKSTPTFVSDAVTSEAGIVSGFLAGVN